MTYVHVGVKSYVGIEEGITDGGGVGPLDKDTRTVILQTINRTCVPFAKDLFVQNY